MLNRRRIAYWTVFLTAMLAFGHLLGSAGDPHAVVSPGDTVEAADVHVPSPDDEAPTCGQVSIPALNAYTPIGFETSTEAPSYVTPAPAADRRADTGDRPAPDLVAFLQVNRV